MQDDPATLEAVAVQLRMRRMWLTEAGCKSSKGGGFMEMVFGCKQGKTLCGVQQDVAFSWFS